MNEKKPKFTPGAIRVFIVSFFTFFLVANFPDASQTYFLYTIAEDAKLTVEQMSLLASAGVIGVTVTCLFGLSLMDKISPRLVMGVTVVIGGLGVIFRGLLDSFGGLMFAFLLTGAMMGVYYFGVNKIVSLWFEQKHIMYCNAIMQSGAAIGFFVALQTCGILADMVGGWQNYFKVLGAIMIVIGVLWFTIVPDRRSENAVLNDSVGIVDAQNNSVIQNLKYVLKSGKVWCTIFGASGFNNYVALVSMYTATVLQMSAKWSLDADSAAGVQSFGNLGSLIGYYVIPFVLMRLYAGKTTVRLTAVAQFVSVTLCIIGLLSGNPGLYTIIFIICGLCNGLGYPATMTYLMEQPEVGGLRSGTAIGVWTLISQGLQIFGMVIAGSMFAAAPGLEEVAFAKLLGIYGYIGVAAMVVLYILVMRDKKAGKPIHTL